MKTLDIERLLVWAYREELPKTEWLGVGGSMWSMMAAQSETMALCDDGRPSLGNRYAVLYQGGPHADARILHAAVKELDDPAIRPAIEEPAALLSDMSEGVQAEAERALESYRVQLACLVMRHARMGTRPDWRVPVVPVEKPVMGARGDAPAWFVMEDVRNRTGGTTRMEVPGYDRVAKRPKPGAYRKYRFEPAVSEAIDVRADWLCWRAALAWLAGSVRLTQHRASGPAAPAWPWEGERERLPARVLKALDRVA